MTSAPASRPAVSLLSWLLPVAVFTGGAVVMVLEILGTRIVGPVYGTSLFTWSALIAVTLVSLALGYWLGGRLADRHPSPSAMFLLFDAAALLVALIPLLREPVFSLTHPMGLRSGALLSSVLLFFAPLTILGMVSPYAVRLAVQVVDSVGRTAGRLYAVSTAGGLAGTLLTGFYLIPTFHVRMILLASAVVLAIPAAIYQVAAARRGLGATLATLLAAGLGLRLVPESPKFVLYSRDSFYSQIKVAQGGNFRAFLLNGAIQSLSVPGRRVGLAVYPYLMADEIWRARPGGREALIVGMGGGLLPPLLDSRGIHSKVVEIDPAVVLAAQEYFLYDAAKAPVAIADGRRYLDEDRNKYDYILLDAFAGEAVPIHLLTREIMASVSRHLNPGGVVALNFVGFRSGPRALPLRSIAQTIRSEFPHLRALACGSPGDFGGNLVVASREPLGNSTPSSVAMVPPEVLAEFQAAAPESLVGEAHILTDDYNPLDLWALAGHEESRREVLQWLPWEVVVSE